MTEWEDYYEILGVNPSASQEEIKKAYRENVVILHPDRMAGMSEGARRRAEGKLKRVNRAYEILGDPQKRRGYDSEYLLRKIRENKEETTDQTKEADTPEEENEPEYQPQPADETPPPLIVDQRRMRARPKTIGIAVLLLLTTAVLISIFSAILSQENQNSEKTQSPPTGSEGTLENQKVKKSLEEWKEKNMSRFPSFEFLDIVIIGDDIWAVGHCTHGYTHYRGYSRIVHSSDHGHTWKLQWQEDTQISALRVYFFNKMDGLVVTDKKILGTKNSGENWDVFFSIEHIPDPFAVWGSYLIEKITIENRQKMTVHLQRFKSRIIETSDGGKTWDYIINKDMYSSKTMRFRTKDKGMNWQKMDKDKY